MTVRYSYRKDCGGRKPPCSGELRSAACAGLKPCADCGVSQYVTNQATRIIVKAAGDLAANAVATVDATDSAVVDVSESAEGEKSLANEAEAAEGSGIADAAVDIDTYKPTILPNRSWKLSEIDLGKYVCRACKAIH